MTHQQLSSVCRRGGGGEADIEEHMVREFSQLCSATIWGDWKQAVFPLVSGLTELIDFFQYQYKLAVDIYFHIQSVGVFVNFCTALI